MAAPQPSQADIDNVVAFSGNMVTPAQAVHLLKKYNNNAESAIGAYFDNPTVALAAGHQETWESMDNTPGGFQIDAGDDRDTSSMKAAASRPNSRASHHREAIDLSAMHEAAGTYETDLQKGLTLSLQEQGIVNSTGQQFGPATQSHYDTRQWAITTTSTNTREIFEHPPASKRRRISDQPVFLRGLPDTGYLPAVLTIYNTIPLAREALRFPPLQVHSYAYDQQWWSGLSDENYKSISVDTDVMLDHSSFCLLGEVQQLMGFLEATKRAYGCADALAGLQYYQNRHLDVDFPRILDKWKSAAMQASPGEQLTQVFTTIALKQTDEDEEPQDRSIQCLDCNVSPTEECQTLYEVMDRTIYSATLMEPVWIDTIGEVVTIRITNTDRPGKPLNVKPPAIWYPDRYLEECRGQSFDMRQRMDAYTQEANALNKLQLKCQQVTMADGRRTIVQDVVRTAMRTIEKTSPVMVPNGLGPNIHAVPQADVSELASDLQRTLDRIDRKVALLEERKNELMELRRQTGQELTKPSSNPFDPPHRSYVLQGVGTKFGIVYVRTLVVEDLVDLDDDEKNAMADEDERGDRWQWWKISWNKDDLKAQQDAARPRPSPGPVVGPISQAEAMSSQFTSVNGNITRAEWAPEANAAMADSATDVVTIGHSIQKVKEYEVLRAVREETESVCLVYANENAMRFQSSPLSPALAQWVEYDNDAFDQELSAEVDRREIEHDEEARRADGMVGHYQAVQRLNESDDIQEGTMQEVKMNMDGAELNGDPPPYDEIQGAYQHVEMQEKFRPTLFGGSRVGMHADNMLDRIEIQENHAAGANLEMKTPLEIDHPHEPLR